jgi:type II secretory pathway pseudopilin PulG
MLEDAAPMKQLNMLPRSQDGFTLIELVVVFV